MRLCELLSRRAQKRFYLHQYQSLHDILATLKFNATSVRAFGSLSITNEPLRPPQVEHGCLKIVSSYIRNIWVIYGRK